MPRPKQFDKQEVLERAVELFWRNGFSATSIQNLVNHLGINRASLYDTFGGKDALFRQALEYYMQQSAEQMGGLEEIGCIKKAIRAMFIGTVGDVCPESGTKGCFIVNTITELLPNKPELRPLLLKSKEHLELFLASLLNQYYKDEEKANHIASYLYTLLSGLQVVAKVNPNKEELLRTIDIGLQILDE